MAADPLPLTVLLNTFSTPGKRQAPGRANPPTPISSPELQECLRAAWHSDSFWTRDIPGLHTGPITYNRSAATLVVAQHGEQDSNWVVCMFSPADAHIAICDFQRLPAPKATIRVADCAHVMVKALLEGDHDALLLGARLKDHARAG